MKPPCDARGHQLDLTKLPAGDDEATAARRGSLRRVRAGHRAKPDDGCVGLLIAGLFVVLFLIFVPAAAHFIPPWLVVPTVVIVWVGFCFLLTFVLDRVPIRSGAQWVNQRVAELRMCYACGYDLSDLRAETDGCTVCPECGAAWRLGGGEVTP